MEQDLFYTIESGDYITLRHLIHEGVKVNTIFYGADPITKSHWSALHICCEKGRCECAKVLLEEGACPDMQDKWNQTPLMYSVCGEWLDLTQLLIKFGAEVNCQDKSGRTAAHVAVNCSDNRGLKLLIDGGVDVNLTDCEGMTPLRLAVTKGGNLDKVTSLLQAGSDVNVVDAREKKTPLQAALSCPSFEDRKSYIRLLLDYKANPNTTDRSDSTILISLLSRYRGHYWHHCPMDMAELDQEKEVMTWLVRNGCDVNNSTQKRGTALHVAVDTCPAFVKHLLELGADPSALKPATLPTDTPKSALYLAAKNQDVETAKLLISCNCPLMISGESASPFRAALDNSDKTMAHLLLEAGYDVATDKQSRDCLHESARENGHAKGDPLTAEDWEFLRGEATRPQSLLFKCRNSVRELLGKNICKNIELLPLPLALRDDVLLKRITHCKEV